MAKGEGKYNPGSSSLASPSTLAAISPLPIEESLVLSILPLPLASACPPSMQTFLLILSFAISPSISHWCNFPVGDLYDVKICVVYLATTPLFATVALIYRNICRTIRARPDYFYFNERSISKRRHLFQLFQFHAILIF